MIKYGELTIQELREIADRLHVGVEGNRAQLMNRILETAKVDEPTIADRSVWAVSGGLPGLGKR